MVKLTKAQKKELKLKKLQERQKALEEAKLQRKKDEIQRELDMQYSTKTKMDRTWRHFMLGLKIPLVREDIKVIWCCFERVIDKKENLLKEIQYQTTYADIQKRLTLAAFSDIIFEQLARFHTFLEKLDTTYENDVKALREGGDGEKAMVANMKDKAEWSMAVLRWAMASLAQDSVDKLQGEAVVKHYEEDKMLNNEREEMEYLLERRFTKIVGIYKDVLKEYFSKTSENRKKLEKLREKDTVMLRIISKQHRRKEENYVKIRKLRHEAQGYEDGTVMADIRANYKKNRDEYNNAKNKMDTDLETDASQFSELVEISDGVIELLKSMAKKGLQILTATRLCRRLQTKQEISGSAKDENPLLLFDNGIETPRTSEALEKFDDLKQFWALVADADISRKTLLDERNKLEKENNLLQEHIRSWMEAQRWRPIISETVSSFGTPTVVEAAFEFRIKRSDDEYL